MNILRRTNMVSRRRVKRVTTRKSVARSGIRVRGRFSV